MSKITTKICVTLLVLAAAVTVTGQSTRRERGDNLYQVISANTMGKGNLWADATGIAFIWDNDGKLRLFPSLSVRGGITNFLQLNVSSRVLSYGFRPGNIAAELKATIPNNRRIRFWGAGLALRFEMGLTNKIQSSLGGYRDERENDEGATGFFPEGFLFEKGTTSITLANDFDLISISSFLPFVIYINTGYAMANNSKFAKYNQFLLRAGVEMKGVGVDFFLEYSLKAFNNWASPLISDILPPGKAYGVYFAENEMFVTPGARIRYSNGLTLFGAASLLLSRNKGSTFEDKTIHDLPPEEIALGISAGFHPFYADWMLHGGISYPIRYTQPAAEMYRGFLLKKNVKRKKRIDIEEKLGKKKGAEDQQNAEEEQKRLDEIEKRKKKVMNEVLLD